MVAASCINATANDQAETSMRHAAQRVLPSGRPVKLVKTSQGMAFYRQQGGGSAIVTERGSKPFVLAYSTTRDLTTETDNPGFNWWLSHVSLSQRAETTKPDPEQFAPRVDSLITTLWGQREPFKFMCPFDHYVSDLSLYGTYQPDYGHYAVGCGPTAMAQYINYYRFPKHGVGSNSVVVKYNEANVTLSADFESATYDYDNMIDDYSGEYTTEQAKAVALLSYHCGIASNVTWNYLGGGTTDNNIINAFVNHFNYNDTAHLISRSRYDEPTWIEMIYTEISAGRPIFYSAKDLNLELGIISGHNFIIDGYDENGLVHVNWGWYGFENGFFDISTLAVQQYTYDDWQGMYVGLYPNRPEHIPGDVDDDGDIDIDDLTELINLLLKGDSQSQLPLSDVNGDGISGMDDLAELINMLLTNH